MKGILHPAATACRRMTWRGATVLAALVLGTAVTLVAAGPAQAANPPCHANSDGSLNCGNTAPTNVWEGPYTGHGNRVVDVLRSNPSWFACWTPGVFGNTQIWYGTIGDDTGEFGFVPQTVVFTPTDPYPGVRRC